MIIVIISSCNRKVNHVEFSLYYWKNNASLTEKQNKILNSNQFKYIYIKICDFKWSESKQKIETPTISNIIDTKKDIIPVFFIENKVFKKMNGNDFFVVFEKKIKNLPYLKDKKRIQIDCDWTIQTKENYFIFLKKLQHKGYKTEATIRLHQIKHADITGIPDVETGVLMIYNLTQPNIFDQENSIYNYDLAISYIQNKIDKYPLQLKAALPAFSWGVHFKYKKIKRLINNTTLNDYNRKELDSINPNLFKSNYAFYLKNNPINKRDIIRYESPDLPDISKMVKYLINNINQDSIEFIFFSLDSKFFNEKYHIYEEIISNYN